MLTPKSKSEYDDDEEEADVEEKRKLDRMKQEGKAGELRDEDVRDVAAEVRDAAMVRFQGRCSVLS